MCCIIGYKFLGYNLFNVIIIYFIFFIVEVLYIILFFINSKDFIITVILIFLEF